MPEFDKAQVEQGMSFAGPVSCLLVQGHAALEVAGCELVAALLKVD